MDLLPCGLIMRRERRERFLRHRLQSKPLVSDPDTQHGTCIKHVPWCMSGSLTRGGGENVPGIPSAWATRNFTYMIRGHGEPIIGQNVSTTSDGLYSGHKGHGHSRLSPIYNTFLFDVAIVVLFHIIKEVSEQGQSYRSSLAPDGSFLSSDTVKSK